MSGLDGLRQRGIAGSDATTATQRLSSVTLSCGRTVGFGAIGCEREGDGVVSHPARCGVRATGATTEHSQTNIGVIEPFWELVEARADGVIWDGNSGE